MCFGSTETGSKDTTTSYTPNPAVSGAATENLNFAQNLQAQGFKPYTGQFVAPFSGQQQSSFGMADNTANTPLVGQATGLVSDVGNAAPQNVSASTISSKMSPYMNSYVQEALAPQLKNLQDQFNQQNRGAAANSTMAGAFGNDAQDAIYRSNLTNNQNIGLSGLVGNAYTSAFNTAIGAGAQDVSNDLGAQTTNANLANTQLQNKLAAAGGLQNIIGTQSNLANLENTFGQQQTSASQANLNALYNQYLMGQQYPFQTTQLLNQTIGAGSQAMPAAKTGVETSYAPNNIGYSLGGALLGSFLAEGGPAPAGEPAVVGERGPELFKPDDPKEKPHLIGKQGPEVIEPKKSGTVVPHEAMETKRAEKKAKPKMKGTSLEDAFGVAA